MSSEYTVTVHELFKYMMRILYTRVKAEWQELDVAYPLWVSTIALNDVCYTATLVVACVACFEVGLIIGIVWTVV